ncbi:MAG: dienelactone hydrolase family protein [Tepidisphaeraceae bacterium]|jgi:predicted esterase
MTIPHADQPVMTAGPDLKHADLVLILMHGRGGSAEDMLGLHHALGLETVFALAPEAAGNTWYPNSFLAPLESNQPYLDSALQRIDTIVNDLIKAGIPTDRIALLGFSQGACLTLEFVARHPRRYGAAIGLTGGLIGPPGTPRNYPGSLADVPVFLGTSDPDPHVPFGRVKETKDVLSRMGAVVELRRYPGMPHTINQDELDAVRELLKHNIEVHHGRK